MMLFTVVGNTLREAASRRWVLALAVAVTAGLLAMALVLRMTVADGVIAGISLVGRLVQPEVMTADAAVAPVLRFSAQVIFYGVTLVMVLATADLAPLLLAPGRIELLLAMPIRRWELLFGTYLAVVALAAGAALYGAAGVCLLIGFKSGVWTAGPLLASAFAALGFAALYAGMMVVALLARSAALSAFAGLLLFALGVVAGLRQEIAAMLSEGVVRAAFTGAARIPPPLSGLSAAAASLAAGERLPAPALLVPVLQVGLFAAASLVFAHWLFARKEY
jgi:ABC-type transport system involved in multi-copper enzyme maturation permease subunit